MDSDPLVSLEDSVFLDDSLPAADEPLSIPRDRKERDRSRGSSQGSESSLSYDDEPMEPPRTSSISQMPRTVHTGSIDASFTSTMPTVAPLTRGRSAVILQHSAPYRTRTIDETSSSSSPYKSKGIGHTGKVRSQTTDVVYSAALRDAAALAFDHYPVKEDTGTVAAISSAAGKKIEMSGPEGRPPATDSATEIFRVWFNAEVSAKAGKPALFEKYLDDLCEMGYDSKQEFAEIDSAHITKITGKRLADFARIKKASESLKNEMLNVYFSDSHSEDYDTDSISHESDGKISEDDDDDEIEVKIEEEDGKDPIEPADHAATAATDDKSDPAERERQKRRRHAQDIFKVFGATAAVWRVGVIRKSLHTGTLLLELQISGDCLENRDAEWNTCKIPAEGIKKVAKELHDIRPHQYFGAGLSAPKPMNQPTFHKTQRTPRKTTSTMFDGEIVDGTPPKVKQILNGYRYKSPIYDCRVCPARLKPKYLDLVKGDDKKAQVYARVVTGFVQHLFMSPLLVDSDWFWQKLFDSSTERPNELQIRNNAKDILYVIEQTVKTQHKFSLYRNLKPRIDSFLAAETLDRDTSVITFQSQSLSVLKTKFTRDVRSKYGAAAGIGHISTEESGSLVSRPTILPNPNPVYTGAYITAYRSHSAGGAVEHRGLLFVSALEEESGFSYMLRSDYMENYGGSISLADLKFRKIDRDAPISHETAQIMRDNHEKAIAWCYRYTSEIDFMNRVEIKYFIDFSKVDLFDPDRDSAVHPKWNEDGGRKHVSSATETQTSASSSLSLSSSSKKKKKKGKSSASKKGSSGFFWGLSRVEDFESELKSESKTAEQQTQEYPWLNFNKYGVTQAGVTRLAQKFVEEGDYNLGTHNCQHWCEFAIQRIVADPNELNLPINEIQQKAKHLPFLGIVC